jgi:amino acid adenylation domain-containing protein
MNGKDDPAMQKVNCSALKPSRVAHQLTEMQAHSGRIPRRDASQNVVPLLASQQGMWLMSELHKDASLFHLPCSWPFKGRIHFFAMQQALDEITRRHEILRTTFPVIQGDPVQAVAPPDFSNGPLVDLEALPYPERWRQAHGLGVQNASRKFHLDKEYPVRKTFLRISHNELLLLNSIHHIAFDGSSGSLYSNEWEALYGTFATGLPSPLPELFVQCGDVAVWQQRWLEEQEARSQLAYWTKQLQGSSSNLELPTDWPRMGQAFVGLYEATDLPVALAQAIWKFTKEERATLFITLLAVLNALLYRYTGQQDFNVGTLFPTRDRMALERLIGPFFNTLILRFKLTGRETFRELLRAVRRTSLESYKYSRYPFENLTEVLQSTGDLAYGRAFRIKFGIGGIGVPVEEGLSSEPSSSKELTAPKSEFFKMLLEGSNHVSTLDLDLSSEKPRARQNDPGHSWSTDGRGSRNFEISIWAYEVGDGLRMKGFFNANLFHQTTVARLLRDFQTLADAVIKSPDEPIRSTNFLAPACWHQLLEEWNDTSSAPEKEEVFSPLFEAQVDRTPDSVAVASSNEQVSYAELKSRALRLAAHLDAFGVGPDCLVALCAGRGIDFLTGVIAAFQVGAAYLPLDPTEPNVRFEQTLSRSRPRIILTTGELRPLVVEKLRGQTENNPPVLSISSLLEESVPDFQRRVFPDPRQLAYVIYTSGSTGVPKGAMLEQAGMLNHLRAKIVDLQLHRGDIVAETASERFDISVWQFLAALLVGGRVEIFDDEITGTPLRMLETAEAGAITILEIVPSLVSAVVDEMVSDPGIRPPLSALRCLLVTGEAIAPETCAKWQSLYPRVPLLNAYGPTECSDDVTHYWVPSIPEQSDVVHIPVGRPVNNTRLYVLDSSELPVPLGILGELHVGGKGVGRGYLFDPEKTARAFLPDPFSSVPGARMYKTGDLVCYRSDGNLEYRGRLDHQVKIRGYRIELGEIEAVLSQHPAVRQAVVLAREDEPGEKYLAAYVSVRKETLLDSSDLRSFLEARLPAHMVPTCTTLLEALPVTSNGKIDRRALPAPTDSRPADESTESGSPIEKKIAAIWSEMFRGQRIGLYDNFFQLGGHSIKAVKMINRVNQAFDLRLSVRSVFEEPTIAELALLIEETLIERLELQ